MIDVDIEQQLGDFRPARRGSPPTRRSSACSAARASGKSSVINAIAGVTQARRGHDPHQRCHAVRLRAADRPAAGGTSRSATCSRTRCCFRTWTSKRICSTASGCARRPIASSSERASSMLLGLGALLRRKPGDAVGRRKATGRHRPRAARPAAHPAAWTSRSPRSTCRARPRSSTTSSACATSSTFRSSTSAIRWRRSRGSPTRWSCFPTASALPSATSTTSWAGSISSLRPDATRPDRVIETPRSPRTISTIDLTTLAFDGGELIVPRLDAAIGERVRARIRARDVSLALCASRRESASSTCWPGRVTAIDEESGPIVDVQLAVGDADADRAHHAPLRSPARHSRGAGSLCAGQGGVVRPAQRRLRVVSAANR